MSYRDLTSREAVHSAMKECDHVGRDAFLEGLTLDTLVRGYTLDAAYQLRLEREVRSIEVGKRADLIVLSRNLFEADAHKIHTSKVLLTMLDGEVVHERGLRHWIADRVLRL